MAISVAQWVLPGTSLLLLLCALYGWWRVSSVRSGLLARDLYKSISPGGPKQELRLSDIVKDFREKHRADLVIFEAERRGVHVRLVFQAKVAEFMQRGESFRLLFDIPITGWPISLGHEYMDTPHPIEPLAKEDDQTFDIAEIVIKEQAHIYLAGLSVGRIKISANFAGTLNIHACRVQILQIGETDERISEPAHSIEGTLQIDGCCIGDLALKENACRNFFLSNTNVGTVYCGKGNPFAGVVLITGRVTLHYDPTKMGAQSLANYSNLRAHLSAISQETSAMVVRSVELRALRKSETWFLRAVSFLYDLTSDYGNRPQLAALTLLLLLAVNLLIISGFDAAVVTADCNDKAAETWIGVLCEGGWASGAAAEVLLSGEPVLNPFGVLSTYPVEAKGPWVALWLWFVRVFSIVLAGLVFIGIRRRIRL